MKQYEPKQIEPKWQQIWGDTNLYATREEADAGDFYQLTMFPYPSGNLHVGHWYALVGPDVLARHHRMNGKNVLFPMGWDAFGLPAENAAIKRGIPPAEWTRQNIATMKQQITSMGASFDWNKEISTAEPGYYQWTQWLFLLLYDKGLAYREKGLQNWCPSCQTVLANEQVIGEDQLCERCDTPVEKKELEQWFFKITEYAEELLHDLEELEWPEQIKTMQRNWIGKSEGTHITFPVADTGEELEAYTTRADTLFGATFMVLAPEYPVAEEITSSDQQEAVREYRESVVGETNVERKGEREKTGVFTGAYAIHPLTEDKIPIWISDYVLMEYGSGAIMAVPAHDERDYGFAQKYDLPITQVITGETVPSTEYGELINSGDYNGMDSKTAQERITEELKKKKRGYSATQYKLHDWLISRQRYWGTPIPIVYCQHCGAVPVPESELPVMLPEDVEFEPTGQSPLRNRDDFVNTACPECGEPAQREVDTMDTFIDSSWYYLRFANPDYQEGMFDPEAVRKWLPVDHYTGGIEHAILHLLYARFVTKVLRDYAGLEFSEPFKKLDSQGVILGPDGHKMSKSRGNIINPDEVIESGYGADSFRTYLLFIGPWTEGGPFSLEGIAGVYRFMNRTWNIVHEYKADETTGGVNNRSELEVEATRVMHKTIKKVSEDIENVQFNTAIAALMEYVNHLHKLKTELPPGNSPEAWGIYIGTLLRLLSPFAPHITEELWQELGQEESIHIEPWPVYDETKIAEDMVTIAVQVNGKTRDRITVPADSTEHEIKERARKVERVKNEIANKEITKTIVAPGNLVNFVV